jgi:hypothetical protein
MKMRKGRPLEAAPGARGSVHCGRATRAVDNFPGYCGTRDLLTAVDQRNSIKIMCEEVSEIKRLKSMAS